MHEDARVMIAAIEKMLVHTMPPIRRFQLLAVVNVWRIWLKFGNWKR